MIPGAGLLIEPRQLEARCHILGTPLGPFAEVTYGSHVIRSLERQAITHERFGIFRLQLHRLPK